MPRGRPAAKRTASKKTTRKSSVKRTRKNDRIVTVNFDGVELGGGSNVPEGEYPAAIESVEQAESNAGYPMLRFILVITSGKQKGKKLYYNPSLQPQALWNLRGMLDACGVETPESSFDIDLDEMIDTEVGVGVTIGQHEGRDRSQVSDFFPIEEVGESSSDEDEEEPEENEEEESEEEEGEAEELTADDIRTYKAPELQELIDENELEVDLSEYKTIAKKRQAVIDEMIEQGMIEEE